MSGIAHEELSPTPSHLGLTTLVSFPEPGSIPSHCSSSDWRVGAGTDQFRSKAEKVSLSPAFPLIDRKGRKIPHPCSRVSGQCSLESSGLDPKPPSHVSVPGAFVAVPSVFRASCLPFLEACQQRPPKRCISIKLLIHLIKKEIMYTI